MFFNIGPGSINIKVDYLWELNLICPLLFSIYGFFAMIKIQFFFITLGRIAGISNIFDF